MGKGGKSKAKKTKKDGAKKELLKWVNDQLEPYGESVKNFKNDWKNPMKVCCLCDSLQPGLMNIEKIKGDAEADDIVRTKDIQEAMSKAETHFEIPQVLDASDMAVLPDELSVMTYVSYFREAAKEAAKKQAAGGKSFAEGPGLEIGVVEEGVNREFSVHAITHENHPMVPDGDEDLVVVLITDPEGNDVKVDVGSPSQARPGVYPISYSANIPGSYQINVTVKGAPLKGFPKTVVVNPATSAEVKSCKFSFTIHAANEDGELETEGGDLFEVELQNCSTEEPLNITEAKDNGDGTYTASYKLYHGHLYKVYAKLNGEAIANTPFIHDLRTDVDKASYVY